MINPFTILLGQQAASQAGVLPTEGNPITVERARSNTEVPAQEEYDPYFGNRKALEARDNAERELSAYRKENPRQGLFGMKGTLRDVIGILGDSFLVQSGNAPMYAPQRMRELQQDQMVGFTNDPMAAAERVGGETGMSLMEAEQERQLKEAQVQSLNASRQNLADSRDYTQIKDARMLAQRILSQNGAYLPDGSLSPGAISLLQSAARNANTTVEQLIGQDTSPDTLRLFGDSDMSVSQQRQLPFTERRVAAQESQARSSATRAARPPAPRNPPQPTRASMLDAFLKIPPAQRTPEQRAFIQRETQPTGSGSAVSRLIEQSQGGGNTPPSRRRIRPVGQ